MEDIRKYSQIDIAISQLERAIQLFREEDDYFSAITLSGAADEIFGKMIERADIESSYTLLEGVLNSVHSNLGREPYTRKEYNQIMNGPRNTLKHVSDSPEIELDARQEACNMIYRAAQNYDVLMILVVKEKRSQKIIDWINSPDIVPGFKLRDA